MFLPIHGNFDFSLLAIVGKAVADRINTDAQNITGSILFNRVSPLETEWQDVA